MLAVIASLALIILLIDLILIYDLIQNGMLKLAIIFTTLLLWMIMSFLLTVIEN